ncbi:MAG: hypothetical protein AAGH78_01490 [Cyanobacteria bacterium P01_H01_bin.58]
MPSDASDNLVQAKALHEAGQVAFERGNYREAVAALEAGSQLVGRGTALGGSIQLWLMNAYFAANRPSDAIALGEILARHPDLEIRKQSKRIMEILQAPKLKHREDWLTPIPDLSDLEAGEAKTLSRSKYANTQVTPQSLPVEAPQPEDLSQINTRDNGFLWLSLVVIVLVLGELWLLR